MENVHLFKCINQRLMPLGWVWTFLESIDRHKEI